jgi:hypothetical protein
MVIYPQETDDGLAEKISAHSSVAYSSVVEPIESADIKNFENKTIGSYNDSDLYYVQSILVSSSWNKNDDIFDKTEVWNARKTPEDKPTNLEHDENVIIGHIVSNWPIDDDGNKISDDTDPDNLPEKFHILTGSVIYKAFSNPELKERSDKLISEIEDGSKYVSMECYFKNFDYGLIDQTTSEYKILPRNNETAYLTKYLRAYGGTGEHQNYKIGRVLRDITFSGKGFVDKPANPDSIIFNKKEILTLLDKKNTDLLNSGVLETKSNLNVENIIMTEHLETQVAELSSKIDTISASCSETVKEAYTLASELKDANTKLESSIKEKDEQIASLLTAKTQLEESLSKAAENFELDAQSSKAAWETEKSDMQQQITKIQAELDTANELISAMKMKEEEMMKKEKMMKRKASLLEAGLDEENASSAIEKFENMDDNSFEAMTSILVAMKMKKAQKDEKDEKETKEEALKEKKMASESEEAISALEEVETEPQVELSVGSNETEFPAESIRSELLEFVSARLHKN